MRLSIIILWAAVSGQTENADFDIENLQSLQALNFVFIGTEL